MYKRGGKRSVRSIFGLMQESIPYWGRPIGDFGCGEYPQASEGGPKVPGTENNFRLWREMRKWAIHAVKDLLLHRRLRR